MNNSSALLYYTISLRVFKLQRIGKLNGYLVGHKEMSV